MMKSFFLSFFLLLSLFAKAQEASPAAAPKDTTMKYVARMPAAPYNVNEYLTSNLHYPLSALKNHVEGRVIIKFVVDKKGRIRNCQLQQGIGWGCDQEALRVVKHMPRWLPGMQGSVGTDELHPINVYFTLPIVFKLPKMS